MKRPGMRSLIAMVALVIGVIFQGVSHGAAMPVLESLGQIKDLSVMRTPLMIDVDAAGNLYVSDIGKQEILKFDRYGKLLRHYTGFLMTCRGLAVTPDGSRLYVSGKNFVAILDGSSGEIVGYLGSGVGEFNSVGEIDLDASGFIFVADSSVSIVKVYSPDGRFQYPFGGRGTTVGKFLSISGLTVDPERNEVYVLDTQENPRIQVFDLAGKFKRIYYGNSTANLGTPYMAFLAGMTVDDAGRAYFLEMFYGQIRYQDIATSRYLGSYNKKGYNAGELLYPYDAIYDPSTGRLFVSCEGNRIEIFGVDGAQNPENTNEAPGKPTLLSPVGESEVFTANPVLKYANAVDPDGDTLVYDVRLTSDAGDSVATYTGLPESEGSSWTQVSDPLQENARYLWSAQAFDGEASSGWTETQGFWVNAVEEAPSAPSHLSPLSEEVLDGSGILSWNAADDPDPFDEISYTVEIVSSDDSLVASSTVEGLSIALSDFADYTLLEDGVTYGWRVKAVDNHGLQSMPSAKGSFKYDTGLFAITANMPDARVYLSGNLAYPGKFLGIVPIEKRDFASGTYSVVVERAGFEPWISQVRIGERENVTLYADLVPAIEPEGCNTRPVQAAGQKIDVGKDAAPFLVDFNNDGLNDLLVGNASGEIILFKGEIAEGDERFASGVALDLPLIPGASPFVVDWNDDGRKDLLVGAADGTVTFFPNLGTEEVPTFGGGSLLSVAGEPIDLDGFAAPVVVDLDEDGGKDLVVGSASGKVLLYRATTVEGISGLLEGETLVSLQAPVAPFFADWDGDGKRELILASDGTLYRCMRDESDQYEISKLLVPKKVFVPSLTLVRIAAMNVTMNVTPPSAIGTLRLFVCDVDGKKGKDVIAGTSDGEVFLLRSKGEKPVPAFTEALTTKASQVEGLVLESDCGADALGLKLKKNVENGRKMVARKLVRKLLMQNELSKDASAAAAELLGLLHY